MPWPFRYDNRQKYLAFVTSEDQRVRLKGTRRGASWVAAAAVALLTSIEPMPDAHAAATRAVDGEALISAADALTDWLTHGRTYDEQRFSPLDQINTGNVRNLGLAWFADLDTARGQEEIGRAHV